MDLLVKLLAIAIIVYGCLLILRPTTLKKIIEWAKQGDRVYWASGIKAAVGLVLMFAATYCGTPWIVRLLGALTLIGGVATFFIKKDAIIKLMESWGNKPTKKVYPIGVIALVIGVLLALAA